MGYVIRICSKNELAVTDNTSTCVELAVTAISDDLQVANLIFGRCLKMPS